MSDAKPGESSAQFREGVIAARKIQAARCAAKPKITFKAHLQQFRRLPLVR